MSEPYFLGLATTFHDPAMAIVGPDGEVLFAEAAERHLQYKRAPNCEAAPISRLPGLLKRHVPRDADIVVATSWGARFVRTLGRAAEAGLMGHESVSTAQAGLNRSFVPDRTERALVAHLHHLQAAAGLSVQVAADRIGATGTVTLRRYPHHLTHAAYGFRSAGWPEAAGLVVDGMGERGAAALFAPGEDGVPVEVHQYRGPMSLGFFFGLITELCGFDPVKGEEWKVMGLAPYGRSDPELRALVDRMWTVEDGVPASAPVDAITEAANALEGLRPADAAREGWADLARVGQDTFEAMMDLLVADAHRRVPTGDLVLTGGCALNSSYNGKLVARSPFSRLHVPSAPADDGNAIGAALLALAEDNNARGAGGTALAAPFLSPYLGSEVDDAPLERMAAWEPRLEKAGPAVVARAARALAEGKLVGWVQGRAEFGPRALGNRSILADPRPADAKAALNAKVKYREAFRPFAPAILDEAGPDWFEDYQDSPYMERTLRWKPHARAAVPAVVHEDGTGRLQSVRADRNGRFSELIAAFAAITGVPILLNTSFNVMGKPILHSTEDALAMFATTGIEVLVVNDWIMEK